MGTRLSNSKSRWKKRSGESKWKVVRVPLIQLGFGEVIVKAESFDDSKELPFQFSVVGYFSKAVELELTEFLNNSVKNFSADNRFSGPKGSICRS